MKKVKIFLSYFFGLIIISNVDAQTIQSQIDNEVWKPFIKAIDNQNLEDYFSLHSKDIIRADGRMKKLFGWDDYKLEIINGWKDFNLFKEKNKIKNASFDLRFLARIANDNLAYEVGYFKSEVTTETGEIKKGFGKFHVVLRKEDGKWKILVDQDSIEEVKITEEDYLKAEPIK